MTKIIANPIPAHRNHFNVELCLHLNRLERTSARFRVCPWTSSMTAICQLGEVTVRLSQVPIYPHDHEHIPTLSPIVFMYLLSLFLTYPLFLSLFLFLPPRSFHVPLMFFSLFHLPSLYLSNYLPVSFQPFSLLVDSIIHKYT